MKVHLLVALDNWSYRMVTSTDDGRTFTPWAQARNLDGSLRRKGWGAVYPGLPGPGVQLRAPSPHAGRLVICSSAYMAGGNRWGACCYSDRRSTVVHIQTDRGGA